MSTIFSKIIAGQAPAAIVYRDEYVTAFKDIHPLAPVHILIVSNKEIATVDDVEEEDALMLGQMFVAAKQIAREQGIAETGYRLIVNCRDHGGQVVYHLHMHLMGGHPLGPMLSRKG
jgi:histidine triad (HIT) family protein